VSDTISKILEAQGWILADGATGTNLFNMGLEAGEAPEIWNDQQPDKIRKLYQDSVDAGSDLFLTNSFGGNASRLKLHNAQNRVLELNRIAAEIGRDVADKSDRAIIVAGSMGPTGEIMEPVGTLSHSTAVEMFHEQAEGLKEGGADVLWVETLSAREEFLAAAEGIALADMPWAGTMSFDTAGRTMMGLTSTDMVKMVGTIKNTPLAFGANCGVGASDLLRTLLGFSEESPSIPLISKGNAGIPKYVDGHIHYDGTPELMAEYAMIARNIGAKIIGGCCGTMPEHLVAMRAALENSDKGEKPTLAMIADKIGAFSSDSDGTGDNPGPKPRERRRRRR
jgi:5-methyltetrahydrofolate--homocysteine methyltransferase